MRTFLVEYRDGEEIRAEIVKASSSMQAVKSVMNSIRHLGRAVSLKLVKVSIVEGL